MEGSVIRAGLGFALALTLVPALAAAEPWRCDHEDIVADMLDIFNYVQLYDLKSGAEMTGLRDIVDLDRDPAEISGYAASRFCTAAGAMADGTMIGVWYTILLENAADPEDYRLKPCFAAFDPVHADCTAFE